MPAKRKPTKRAPRPSETASVKTQVQAALASLEKMSTRRDRENLARFGITATKAFGVSIANIQGLARRLGRSHELAAGLWDTGWYEARLLTSFVDEPARVTPAQMDRWCRDFDNWGICDTICFHLFDRTPHAWAKVAQWHDRRGEFVKRAAFALLASLALHDKLTGDQPFVDSLALIERAADRRAQLRQERRELGAAADRKTQPGAERRSGHAVTPAVDLPGCRRPMDRERRAQGTHQPHGPAPPRWPAPWRSAAGAGLSRPRSGLRLRNICYRSRRRALPS